MRSERTSAGEAGYKKEKEVSDDEEKEGSGRGTQGGRRENDRPAYPSLPTMTRKDKSDDHNHEPRRTSLDMQNTINKRKATEQLDEARRTTHGTGSSSSGNTEEAKEQKGKDKNAPPRTILKRKVEHQLFAQRKDQPHTPPSKLSLGIQHGSRIRSGGGSKPPKKGTTEVNL